MLDIYMVIMYGLMDTNFLDFWIFPLCVSVKKVIMVKILPPIPEILACFTHIQSRMLSRGIVFVILSKNEEPHYLILKMKNAMKMLLNSLDFGYTSKKRRTPFYWVSKLRRAIRKWLQPLDFGYISKKRRTPLFGIKNEERHENVAKFPRFWVYLQKKKNTIFWVSKLRAIRKWQNPWILGISSEKRRTPYLYATDEWEILEQNFAIIFGRINKKWRTLILGNRTQKNDKILEKWKSFG